MLNALIAGQNVKSILLALAAMTRTENTSWRAGCFLGDLDAFVIKATGEGKLVYAKVIPAIAEALKDHPL